MFNVSCKDPLDAEKVGERRARKNKEAKEVIDSVNDTLSTISVSGHTPETHSFAFSPPLSGRSSRTSVISPSSQRSAGSPENKNGSVRDYFSFKSGPSSSSNRPKTRERNLQESAIESAVNPFASHSTYSRASDVPSRSTGEWNYIVSASSSRPAAPSRASVASSRPTSLPVLDVERPVSVHTGITNTSGGPNPWKRFQRSLKKIEKATDETACIRLAERWPADDDDEEMMHEFDYETTLWALVRAQKLSNRQLPTEGIFPVPAGLNSADKETFHGANILHLGMVRGCPESWYLGTKYTDTVVHSVGFRDLPFDLASSSWGLPPNVLLEQWSEFPRLDYVDAIFDNVIIAHHLFEAIKCTLWPVLIEEVSRVLAPGGLLIVSIMDALPQRAGPLLDYWTHQNLNMNVLRRFMVHQPSLLLPSWVNEDGRFCQELIERIEFPCMPALGNANKKTESAVSTRGKPHKRRPSYTSALPTDRPGLGRITEVSEIRTAGATTSAEPHHLAASRAGWNFYERLYSSFLSEPTGKQSLTSLAESQLEGLKRDWWTKIDDVRKECYTQQPYFEMATFVYRRTPTAEMELNGQRH